MVNLMLTSFIKFQQLMESPTLERAHTFHTCDFLHYFEKDDLVVELVILVVEVVSLV
jgi:hypothetical protein